MAHRAIDSVFLQQQPAPPGGSPGRSPDSASPRGALQSAGQNLCRLHERAWRRPGELQVSSLCQDCDTIAAR